MIRRTTLFTIAGLALLLAAAGASASDHHDRRHHADRYSRWGDHGTRIEFALFTPVFYALVHQGLVAEHEEHEEHYDRHYEERRPDYHTSGYGHPRYWRHHERATYRTYRTRAYGTYPAQERVRYFDSHWALRHFLFHHPEYRFYDVVRTRYGWALVPS